MSDHSLRNPFSAAFRTSILVLVPVTTAVLWFLVLPVVSVVPFLGLAVMLLAWSLPTATLLVVIAWALRNRTVPILGIALALMPMQFMTLLFGNFFGVPHMATKWVILCEGPPLLVALILWRRNGFRLAAPDWFLLGFVVLGVIRTLFGGGYRGFVDDFGFLIAYVVGRVTILSDMRERSWAKAAVWIIAVLAMLGMIEVFVLGDAPRTALYALAFPGGPLPDAFVSRGLGSMREASTTIYPTVFAAFCMIALILWWVYLRNPIAAGIIFAGLLCTVTRSSWIGTAVAIPLLALRLRQKERLATYALIGVLLFAAAIPFLGLNDFLRSTRTGQDDSAQVHRASFIAGLQHVVDHPFGSGAESVGPRAVTRDESAMHIESAYVILMAQYGVVPGLCLVGFLLSSLTRLWKHRTPLASAATAILIGFGIMMLVLPMHEDFTINCWVWFPIGLAVRSTIAQTVPSMSAAVDELRGETA